MLRLIIKNHGEDWREDGVILAVLDSRLNRLTRRGWRAVLYAVRASYQVTQSLISWRLVQVQSSDDPLEIDTPWGRRAYGAPVAFGQMGDTYPDRCWEIAWRWVGLTCQKIMERSYINVD